MLQKKCPKIIHKKNLISDKIGFLIYRSIIGSVFLNLQNIDVKYTLIHFWRKTAEKSIHKDGLNSFIDYLEKYYFGEMAVFPHKLWNYYSLIKSGVTMFSSNPIEANNLCIKKIFGRGFMGQDLMDRRCKKFFRTQLKEATMAIKQKKLNLRKKSTREREEKIFKIFEKYSELNCEDQKLDAHIYSVDLGTVNFEHLDSDFWNLNEKPDENDITQINPKVFDSSHEVSECHETLNYDPTFLNFSVDDL